MSGRERALATMWGRSRSWSTEQKKATVAEIDVGGATLSEAARRHGVHANVLFRWHRELGSAMGAPPGEARLQ